MTFPYWIQTFTGKIFDLANPTADMICIEDIAHHLSIENRYNGATKFPYSVAHHSYLGMLQAPDEFKLEFLFHDSHEAYYKDWTSPFKAMMLMEYDCDYDDIISKYEEVIQRKFKLNFSYYIEEIKTIDRRMAKTEKNLLMNVAPICWHPSVENAEPFSNINIMRLSFDNVERLFLGAYNRYKRV